MHTEPHLAAVHIRRQDSDPTGTMPFEDADTGWQGHWLMVQVRGNVSAATTPMLRARLRRALGQSLLTAVNMAAAHLSDASGLAVLIGIHRHAQLNGRVFLVVAPTPHTSAMLHATGLDKRLLICPTFTDFLTWSGTLPHPANPHHPSKPPR